MISISQSQSVPCNGDKGRNCERSICFRSVPAYSIFIRNELMVGFYRFLTHSIYTRSIDKHVHIPRKKCVSCYPDDVIFSYLILVQCSLRALLDCSSVYRLSSSSRRLYFSHSCGDTTNVTQIMSTRSFGILTQLALHLYILFVIVDFCFSIRAIA